MMNRKDKKRLPISYLPNGSGNDSAFCVNVSNIDEALDYLVQGNIIKVDINKVLVDTESDEKLCDEEKLKSVKYMFNTCSFGLLARIL
jgi:diacylglycerol kinase family enzyme